MATVLASVLLLIGVIGPVLYMLIGVLRSLRRSSPLAGWLDGAFAAVAAIAVMGTLIVHTIISPLATDPVVVFFLLGVVELLYGVLLVALIERRRQDFAPDRSPGILSLGMGFFTIVMAVFIPILPGQFFPPAAPTLYYTATPTATVTLTPTPTPQVTATLTTAPTATNSPTVTSLPTATPTREPYHTPTPTATPTVAIFCGALVNYNLNLRAAPSLDAEIRLVIPYETIIQVAGRNEAAEWWFVTYDGTWGWVDGQYLSLDTSCDAAPVLHP